MNIADRILLSEFVSLPKDLFENIRDYGLTFAESYVLIQIWYLTYIGKKTITDDLLVESLSSDEQEILEILAGLISKMCISYTEKDGKMSYDLDPLINNLFIEKKEQEKVAVGKGKIFTHFESEFKRPLSPIEIDLIDEWIETKGYPESMIFEVLKVAVANAKLSFKYIDRVLIDWSKKGVTSQNENEKFELSRKTSKPKLRQSETKNSKKSKYDDIYKN